MNTTQSITNITTVLGILYLVAILCTYLFQFITIFRKKGIDGISGKFLLLGNISALLSMCNAIVFYFDAVKECETIPTQNCFNNVSGLLQFITQFICILIFYIIFIHFHVKKIKENVLSENDNLINLRARVGTANTNVNPKPNLVINSFFPLTLKKLLYKKPFQEFISLILIVLIGIFLTFGLLSLNDWSGNTIDGIQSYARALGYLSVTAVCLQYLPQIYTTYKRGDSGSLSTITLVLMAGGNLFSIGYFIHQGISDYTTWLPFAICSGLLIVLIVEILCFKYIWPRRYPNIYDIINEPFLIVPVENQDEVENPNENEDNLTHSSFS